MLYKLTNSILIFSLSLGIISFAFTNCGKYEEGPGFSLRTKKGRLTGTWQSTKLVDIENNEDTTYTSLIYEIKKDNSFTQRSTQSSLAITGEWEFSDDKKFLYTTFSYSFGGTTTTTTDTSLILRLKNNELWLSDKDREEQEIHFEKQ